MVQEAKAKLEQILDSQVAIEGKALDIFESAEQTADGTEQDIAHGLLDADFAGRVPTFVWTEITSIPTAHAGPITLVQGTHDATNCKITGTNDAGFKYKVFAV
jgi:hypothetical protein